jgi:hypothetical protein
MDVRPPDVPKILHRHGHAVWYAASTMRPRILLAALALAAGEAAALTNPLIFVTQTPTMTGEADIATVTGTFSTHLPSLQAAPRGGSLHILYSNGTLRDLLADAIAEACANARPACAAVGPFAVNGSNTLTNAYAAREPMVHWDGDKVIFSLLTKVSPAQFQVIPASTRWQMYEIAGLAQGSSPVLTRVANQPAEYNNVSPVYGSDDKIFFSSDRPITGNPIHYPQIEEYESGPTVSGLWKLDPGTGALALLDHSPSGVFTPFVDSFGQVLFTRWDHLQQDQQALNAVEKALNPAADDYFRAYTYLSENDVGEAQREFVEDFVRRKTALNTPANDLQAWGAGETAVPEYHLGHPVLSGLADMGRNGTVAGNVSGRAITHFTPSNKYGKYDGLRFNLFVPWQINQDGSGHETFRHMGRHDVGMYANKSYMDDNALSEFAVTSNLAPMNGRDGYFQLTEYPLSQAPGGGTYLGIAAPEFNTHASGFILRMRDTARAISENGLAVQFDKLTSPASQTRYRNPVMLSDGTLIAAVDEVPANMKDPLPANQKMRFRLYTLKLVGGFYEPDQPLSAGVSRTFTYWDPDALRTWSGRLWELSPVEVRTRPRPAMTAEPALPAPESVAFADAGVDVAQFRQYLRDNDLALIVSRNVTRRDGADNQQPANLRVDPQNVPAGRTGAQTLKTGQAGAKIYDVAKLQLYQNDLVRGYGTHSSGSGATFKDGGRRGLARPLHNAAAIASNPTSTGVPGVKIAHDGSFAAFVPARRALTWTLADRDEAPVVRERYWLTFAAGEVRVCASCHGVNQQAQDGGAAATSTPQALRDLLAHWKVSESGPTSIVTHYYQSFLRRAPDSGGRIFWEDESVRVRAYGASVNEAFYALSAAFLGSAEYAAFNRDNAGFVTDLYVAFFNRSPDAGGLAFWTANIAQGMPREVAYVSFLFSAEFDAYMRGIFGQTAARAEIDTVLDFYRGFSVACPIRAASIRGCASSARRSATGPRARRRGHVDLDRVRPVAGICRAQPDQRAVRGGPVQRVPAARGRPARCAVLDQPAQHRRRDARLCAAVVHREPRVQRARAAHGRGAVFVVGGFASGPAIITE